jgi:1,4-dihydroxy-2-naphthoate polyprenyltransferase
VIRAYCGLPIALAATGGPAWGLLALLSLPIAPPALRLVATRTDGPALNAALARTGALLAAFSVLLAGGLLVAVA